jgi:hypothetical protein
MGSGPLLGSRIRGSKLIVWSFNMGRPAAVPNIRSESPGNPGDFALKPTVCVSGMARLARPVGPSPREVPGAAREVPLGARWAADLVR